MALQISDTTPRSQYTATSGQTSFSVPFEFFAAADLKVYNGTSLLTYSTSPSSASQYSVTGAGVTGGGSITLGSPGATLNDTITIVRDLAIERISDFPVSGNFPIQTLNTELDKIVAMLQQLEEQFGRTLQYPVTTTTGFNVDLPELVANRVLSVNADATALLANQELGTFKGNWAASTSYQIRDLVKDTSNGNIYFVNAAHTSSGTQPLSSNANSSKYDLIIDAASATTSATNAASSASAAASSASAASTSASNAATSESNAATSESNASTSASNASTSATNASNSATAAATSASNAATSESNASTSATNAASSASAASSSATSASNSASTATTQASNASTSASNAATSASNAATSESNAATSESNAATSASNASTSATNASNSASAASTSATNAANSAAAAEATFDLFDDSYLGAKASNPTLDNDGNALQDGALYFDTTNNVMKVYDLATTTWLQLTPTVSNQTNINTVAGISGDVSTVAGISSDVTTAAGISSNISTVAGISSNVTTVAGDTANIGTIATNLNGTDTIGTVAANIANVNAVGGISANVTTVAGISSDVTAVALDATDIGIVATNIGNVNNVGGSIANVNTVASNIVGVNSFAERYRVDSSDPSTSLDAGDLVFNTTASALKYYDGSSWQQIVAGSLTDVVQDTTPQLGGTLDLNSNDITGTGNINITGNISLTGTVDGRDVSTDGTKLDGIATSATANPNAIDNLVEDLTPELGGALSTNGNDINFGDNDKANFGASNDLQIFHDGSNSQIVDSGTGDLYIKGANNIYFQDNTSGDVFARFNNNTNEGNVKLYYNNLEKLATTSSGIDVTGTVTADGGSFSGPIDMTSSQINFQDNGKATFGNASDLQIYHDGGNSQIYDSGTGNLNLTTNGTAINLIGNNGNEYMAIFTSNGASTLYYDNAPKIATTTNGITVTGYVLAQGSTVGFAADDNVKVQLGNSGDFQIYHDGSNSYIKDTGTGDLYLQGSANVRITDTDGNKMFLGQDGGETQLYYNGSEKLATKSTGVNVTGALTVNGSGLSGFSRYVNFNGTGTVAIRNSSGISSVTDQGTGAYTINFSTAIGNTNYLVLGTADRETGQRQCMVTIDQNNNGVNSGSCSIRTLNDGVTDRDAEIICVGILT